MRPDSNDRGRGDFARVLLDFAEALSTGRQPEDVQRERHERERAEVTEQARRGRRFRWFNRGKR